jgi:hypothetical protein
MRYKECVATLATNYAILDSVNSHTYHYNMTCLTSWHMRGMHHVQLHNYAKTRGVVGHLLGEALCPYMDVTLLPCAIKRCSRWRLKICSRPLDHFPRKNHI